MKSDSEKSNNLKSAFWTIKPHETKKFLLLSFMLFFIIYVYSFMKDLKDVFIQTYAVAGCTEVLAALKLWFVLPSAILIVMIYSFLINRFGFNKSFYVIILFFASFLVIFALFLFPNYQKIHGTYETVENLRKACPMFLYYVIPCVTNWSFSLFYVLAEIWSTLVISSLFWQLANNTTTIDEGKRFFAAINLIGTTGNVASGFFLEHMSHSKGIMFDKNIQILLFIATGSCVAIIIMKTLIDKSKSVVFSNQDYTLNSKDSDNKNRSKTGLMDGFKILFSSKYLLMTAIIAISYGITQNLCEVMWKGQMKIAFPNSYDYGRMQGILTMSTGILSILFTVICIYLLKNYSWKLNALITPVLMSSVYFLFFILIFISQGKDLKLFGMPAIIVLTWVGLFAIASARGIKYCSYDVTKNMIYHPLDKEERIKGQAAVEVVGSRVGKASSSTVINFMTSILKPGSTILSHSHSIFVIFVGVVASWVVSIFKLSTKYEKKVSEKMSNI